MNFYNYNNPKNNIDRILYCGEPIFHDALAERVKEAVGLSCDPVASLLPDLSDVEGERTKPRPSGLWDPDGVAKEDPAGSKSCLWQENPAVSRIKKIISQKRTREEEIHVTPE